jgi:hypothetical protein
MREAQTKSEMKRSHVKKHLTLATDDLESYISEVKSVFQQADFS